MNKSPTLSEQSRALKVEENLQGRFLIGRIVSSYNERGLKKIQAIKYVRESFQLLPTAPGQTGSYLGLKKAKLLVEGEPFYATGFTMKVLNNTLIENATGFEVMLTLHKPTEHINWENVPAFYDALVFNTNVFNYVNFEEE